MANWYNDAQQYAFEIGAVSRKRKKDLSRNPYCQTTEFSLYTAWNDGYLSVVREENRRVVIREFVAG